MGALDVELESLRARVATDPTRAATVARRIAEVESAIKSADSAAVAKPQAIEAAVAYEVETATLPKAKRK